MLATARPPGHLMAYTRMRFHRVSGTRVWLYYGAYMKDYLIGKSTNSASYIIAILSLHLALITMLAHYTC